MNLEICSYSLESSINAQKSGAVRVELCSGPGEGGTTPSAGMIEAVRQAIHIALYVMIRPRGGDFVYSQDEVETMKRDIDFVRKAGADGVVLGILLTDGKVDVDRTRELVQYAQPLGVTFHRAFDLTPDPLEALEAVILTGAERILTSGQQPTAPAGASLLASLVSQAQKRIEIMAGGGVSAANALALAATGVDALHLTGKSFRAGRQTYFPSNISMAGEVPDERTVMYSDPARIEAIVQLFDQKEKPFNSN